MDKAVLDKTVASDEASSSGSGSGSQSEDRVAYLETELKKVIGQRDVVKARNAELEPLAQKLSEIEKSQMSESEKLHARVKELETYKERSEQQDKVFLNLVEKGKDKIPEGMRDLLKGSPAEQYQTMQTILSALPANGQTKNLGTELPHGKGGNTITTTELNKLPVDEWRAKKAAVKEGRLTLIEG